MPAARPMMSVGEIFCKAQEGTGGYSKYAKMLWSQHTRHADACWEQTCGATHFLMTIPPRTNKNADRALGFLAYWAAYRSGNHSEAADQFVEDLMWDLHALSKAKDKTVRTRACQLLALLLHKLPGDYEMSEELAEGLQKAMLERLRDRQPPVRVQAISALSRLADPGQDEDFAEDEVTHGLIKLLGTEKNKDVRIAAISSLPVSQAAMQATLERTHDVSDDVRRVAYNVLASNFGLQLLSAHEAAKALAAGLQDRSPKAQSAAQKMLQSWLKSSCDGNPVALLQHLDVVANEDAATATLKALMDMRLLKPAQLVDQSNIDGIGLSREPEAQLLTPAEALLWRHVCEHLQQEAAARGQAAAISTGASATVDAAAAAGSLQLLEAVLPDTVAGFMALTERHAAAGDADSSFATCQLLHTACSCLDLADAAGRDAAAASLQHMLSAATRGSVRDCLWIPEAVQLARKVYSPHAALLDMLLDTVTTAVTQQASACEGSNVPPGLQWQPALRLYAQLLQQLLCIAASGGPSQRHVRASQLLPRLVFDCSMLDSREEAIRSAVMECAALGALIWTPSRGAAAARREAPEQMLLPVALLRGAVLADKAAVACTALQGLADLMMVWGPASLDALYIGLIERPPSWQQSMPASLANPAAEGSLQPLLQVLMHCLTRPLLQQPSRSTAENADEPEGAEAAGIAAEALAKLLMLHACTAQQGQGAPLVEGAAATQVLARLLGAYFHAAAQAAPVASQCLSIFFPAFAAAGPCAQRIFCEAAIPAARWALTHAPAGGAASKAPAPRLLAYVSQLLPAGVAGDAQQGQLAEAALKEVLACPHSTASRPYLAALMKVAMGAPVTAEAPAAQIKALHALAENIASSSAGPAIVKDANILAARLEAMDETPLDGLTEEQLEALMASVEQLRLADDAPFADHGRTASNSTGSGRQQSSSLQARTPACPARSTASMRPASVRQPAVSYKEASSEDETSDSSEDA